MNRFHATAFLCLAIASSACSAQDIKDVEAKPYGSYTGGAIDTVDLASGNLMLNIPLVSFPQLGALPPLAFSVELNNAPYSQAVTGCDALGQPNGAGQFVDGQNGAAMICMTYTSRYDTSPPGGVFQQPIQSVLPYLVQRSPPQSSNDTLCGNNYGGTYPQDGAACTWEDVWLAEDQPYVDGIFGAYVTSSFGGGIVRGQANYMFETVDGNPNVIGAGYDYSLIDPSGTTHELESDADPYSPGKYRASDGSGYMFAPSGAGEGSYPFAPENFGMGATVGIPSTADWITDATGAIVKATSGLRMGTLYSPTGIQYTNQIVSFPVPSGNQSYNGGGNSASGNQTLIPRAIMSTEQDLFGNKITRGPWYWTGYWSTQGTPFSDIQSLYSSNPPQYVDSINRVIPDIVAMQSTMYQWAQGPLNQYTVNWPVPGPNGQLVTYKINYTLIYNSVSWVPNTLAVQDPAIDINATGWAIASITLPNNTSWQFTYSGPDLQSITTPSGGTISYTYAPMTSGENAPVKTTRCNGICHAVQSRTETDGLPGSVPGQHSFSTNYTYNTLSSLAGCSPIDGMLFAFSTTETDPEGNDTVHSFCALTVARSLPVANQYHETQTDYYQGCQAGEAGCNNGSGRTWLKTEATAYQYTPDINPPVNNGQYVGLTNVLPTQITTSTLAGTSTETRQYSTLFNAEKLGCGSSCFAAANANNATSIPIDYLDPTSESTKDASGNTLRTTTTAYEFQSSTPAYTNANLISLPTSVSVSGATNDASGKTTYTYDESSYVSPPGSYGALTSKTEAYTMVQGWSPTSVTTHTAYNTNGMPITKIDGKGYATQISYDSTGLFPNEIQRPVTNGFPHNDFYIYDSAGDLKSHTDENGQPTTYNYDAMGRITAIWYPDGGGSSFCYTDSGATCNLGGFKGSAPFSLYTYTLAAPDPAIATSHSYDGWGRQYQSGVLSDPIGVTTVNTTFDWAGRVASVTNPFRSTSSSTDGITSYTYDALGRKTIQVQPDGSMQKWCYDGVVTNPLLQGNCLASAMQHGTFAPVARIDLWDETSRHTQQIFDTLGHMGSVIEPDPTSGNLAMETDYAYDVYGDMKEVDQYGEATSPQVSRYFWYDLPGRVSTSENPEAAAPVPPLSPWQESPTGRVSYFYDDNSNLVGKADWDTISGSTVDTSYTYDALNRLLSKTYLNDPSGTASTCYIYDTASNGLGRLGSQWTQKAACLSPPALPSGGILTKSAISAYDAMGRVKSELRCMGLANCSSGGYAMAYTYDLAGKLTSYPSGPNGLTFANAYDAVGHLLSLTNTSQGTTLFSAPSYTPTGALSGVTLGSSLNMTRTFDSRLRVTSETDSHP